MTEWRAAALLKHSGHRFPYYLVEKHDWVLPLAGDRRLEFQLTPYLHFPGTMVPDHVDYIVANATPFHQHCMPSRELLVAGADTDPAALAAHRAQAAAPHLGGSQ